MGPERNTPAESHSGTASHEGGTRNHPIVQDKTRSGDWAGNHLGAKFGYVGVVTYLPANTRRIPMHEFVTSLTCLMMIVAPCMVAYAGRMDFEEDLD